MGKFENGNVSGKGRPKGSNNKLNIDVRASFYYVYENMVPGQTGEAAFLEWGRLNKNLFYTLFSKLLPKEIKVEEVNHHEAYIFEREKLEAEIVREGNYRIVDADSEEVEDPETTETTTRLHNSY